MNVKVDKEFRLILKKILFFKELSSREGRKDFLLLLCQTNSIKAIYKKGFTMVLVSSKQKTPYTKEISNRE
jgi:hypothetical protein